MRAMNMSQLTQSHVLLFGVIARAACLGKKAYGSYSEASSVVKKVATSRNRQFRRRGHQRMAVYRCDACRHWHVGNTDAD